MPERTIDLEGFLRSKTAEMATETIHEFYSRVIEGEAPEILQVYERHNQEA